MAKWRLTTPHYLYSGTDGEWEYSEQQRATGKALRQRFKVPVYIEAETVVTNDERYAGPGVMFFEGDPTPDMMPLDDEAEKISAGFADKWKHPIDTLPGNFSQSLLTGFEKQLSDAIAKAGGIPSGEAANPVSVPGVTREEFEATQKQMADLVAQNAKLLEALEAHKSPGTSAAATARRA